MVKSKLLNYMRNANINKIGSHFSFYKLAMINGNCWKRFKIFSCKADRREKKDCISKFSKVYENT